MDVSNWRMQYARMMTTPSKLAQVVHCKLPSYDTSEKQTSKTQHWITTIINLNNCYLGIIFLFQATEKYTYLLIF